MSRTDPPHTNRARLLLGGIGLLLGAWTTACAGEPGGESPGEGLREQAADVASGLPGWMQEDLLGVAVWQVLAAFLCILLGLVFKKVVDYGFEARLLPLLKRSRFGVDHVVAEAASRPVGWAVLLLGAAAAFSVLPLPAEPNVAGFVFGLVKVLLAGDVVWFLFRLVDAGEGYLRRLTERTGSRLGDQLVPVVRKALKATIAVIGFVWVVQLLGGNVSSLIAGLGIGGLAVALALQDTLANFFGSVFIILDRPFLVGDWVKIGDVEGIVEDLGFRSTRIRTWPATLVSIPNKTVAAATVDNWSKMPKRRVVQTLGVTYATTADQMEQLVPAIRDILENDEGVDKEFIVVRFTDFGDSSLNILLYYFTTATGFADHSATRERINLAVMRLLEERGLEIAFPTHSIHIESQPLPAPRGPASDTAQE